MSQTVQNNQEELLKILGKGMVTIPKKWRKDLGIDKGDIVKVRKEGKRLVIEATRLKAPAPYRVYSAAEIDDFLEEDRLSESLAQKAKKTLPNIS